MSTSIAGLQTTRRPASPQTTSHSAPHLVLRRKCACGGTPSGDTTCETCRQKELGVQRLAAETSKVSVAPPTVNDVLRSPGQPLDTSTRAVMEPLFAFDFSRVRIHTDSQAAESAHAVAAHAYSVGQHIVFGADQYQPRTFPGQLLLAHELVHTLQQQENDAGPSDPLAISHPKDRSEREAERVAGAVMGKLGVPSVAREPAHIARQEEDDGDAGAPQDASLPGGIAAPPVATQQPTPVPALPDSTGDSSNSSPGPDATPPVQVPAQSADEQHGDFWWWLHSLGLTETKHERADLLRKGWGPPLVITDQNGEVVDVASLSDDEIIALNRRLRGRPIPGPTLSAIPTAPVSWPGTQSSFGKEIEWPARGKVVTPAENVDLAKLQRAGVTEEWATKQAQIYREIAQSNPNNPSAALRAEWLEKVAARLRGNP